MAVTTLARGRARDSVDGRTRRRVAARVRRAMRELGRALAGPFGVPLQLLGVLLVIALLGALYFARAED